MSTVRVAIEGCGHGTLHAIYASVERSCKEKGWDDIDLLIICGDFQSVRNAYDLQCVAMPAKYREMCDFHEYYAGKRKAPYLTIFVGGNHEASNYLYELYYGGWVAENIYYMGAANVLKFGPLRIAGMSGIWKGYNYNKPHYERLPYNADDIKSIYHVRDLDARKLLQVTGKIDIGISHDWPRGVEWMGDWKALFRKKDHLEPDARADQLGNVAARNILNALQPGWWFSGHLHCKYAAIVDHSKAGQHDPHDMHTTNGGQRPTVKSDHVNADEIELDLDLDEVAQSQPIVLNDDAIDLDEEEPLQPDASAHDSADIHHGAQGTSLEHPGQNGNDQATDTPITRFLALDKCLPGRSFLQLLEITSTIDIDRPYKLSYDKEWLSISRAFALSEPLLLGEPKFNAPRSKSQEQYKTLIDEQLSWLKSIPDAQLIIPQEFMRTAPVYDGGNIHDRAYSSDSGGLREYTNPQTVQYCKLLDIPNHFDMPEHEREERMRTGPRAGQDFRDTGRGNRGGRGRSSRGSKRGGWRGER